VTLILVHHYTKAAARSLEVPVLEDLSQSGFAEFARVWWLIGRREEYDHKGNHKLWLNAGSSVGFSGLFEVDISEGFPSDEGGRHWEVEVIPAHEAAIKRVSDKAKADIEHVRLLLENMPGLSMTAIHEAVHEFLTLVQVKEALKSPLFVKGSPAFDAGVDDERLRQGTLPGLIGGCRKAPKSRSKRSKTAQEAQEMRRKLATL
jgi:hypothetical protein